MKKVFPLLALILYSSSLLGQYDPRENYYDGEFFFAEEDYAEALYAFTQVYESGYEDNANVNYRIGVCLHEIEGRKTEAIPYLEKASEKISEKYREGSFREENAPPEVLLYLGNAYRIDHQFDNARQHYLEYLEYADPDSRFAYFARLQIEACDRAEASIDEPVEYQAGVLGQMDGPNVPIYNLTVSGDLQTAAFMGRHKFYNGVYVARKQDGRWQNPLGITPSIQSDGNQDVLSLSHDGNKILLAWNDEFDSEIWYTEWKNNRWNKSMPIGDPVNSRFFESHACLTPDGNSIYFTSNRRESSGEMDIFKCDLLPDGSWSEVRILGENINTVLNEEAPFVSPDGKRLYFSSQGHEGIGGFDIFYVNINDDGTYSAPVNLGYPLNTTDDDFGFMPTRIDYDGYLTTYANGEAEQVELFRFEMIPDGAQPVAVAFLPEEAPEEEMVAEEIAEEVAEEVEEEVVGEEEVVEEEVAEEAAEEEAPVEEETSEPEMLPASYIVRPIFFGFDSYALSDNALSKLDDIATVMKMFPEARLTIRAHTDAVGTDHYNMELAKNRAWAVRKHLISLGVDEGRLSLKSLGEREPAARNRTPDNRDAPKGRALNRRVEFRFINTSDAVAVEEIEVPEHLKIK